MTTQLTLRLDRVTPVWTSRSSRELGLSSPSWSSLAHKWYTLAVSTSSKLMSSSLSGSRTSKPRTATAAEVSLTSSLEDITAPYAAKCSARTVRSSRRWWLRVCVRASGLARRAKTCTDNSQLLARCNSRSSQTRSRINSAVLRAFASWASWVVKSLLHLWISSGPIISPSSTSRARTKLTAACRVVPHSRGISQSALMRL